MRKESVENLDLDQQKLIEMLNGALAEEWLAYYQYWIGSKVLEGPMRSEIESEMLEHAYQELAHAEKVVTRILQLGGTPLLNPEQWQRISRCKYETPNDEYVETILEQNLRSERCAIERYREIISYTKDTDFATANIATLILEEELDHERDILDFQHDIKTMKEHLMQLVK